MDTKKMPRFLLILISIGLAGCALWQEPYDGQFIEIRVVDSGSLMPISGMTVKASTEPLDEKSQNTHLGTTDPFRYITTKAVTDVNGVAVIATVTLEEPHNVKWIFRHPQYGVRYLQADMERPGYPPESSDTLESPHEFPRYQMKITQFV